MNVELKIIGISNLGQGFGFLPNDKNKTFISKTVSGDFIEAKITRKNNKFSSANLIKIITPSPNRKTAPCQYFSSCGGCSLQHLSDQFYQNYKQKNLSDLIRDLNFNQNINWIWIKENSRRRAVFHINENNEIGFYKEASNELVKISECLMLEPEISKLISPLQNILNNLPKNSVSQISASLADNGLDLVFYLKKVNEEIKNSLINFAKENKIIRVSYKNSDRLKLLFESETPVILNVVNDFPQLQEILHCVQDDKKLGVPDNKKTIRKKEIKIELPPEIFLQATRAGQEAITKEIINFIKLNPQIKSVADLYCGVGTYSFALPAHLKIRGFEGDEIMTNNINKNASKNNLQNFISAEKRDLVLNPLQISELKNYDLVLINPPRNGAKSQVEVLAKSKVKSIIMVSCNPHSFIIDAIILQNSGYKITQLTAIDQFYYSHHLEIVCIFEKQ